MDFLTSIIVIVSVLLLLKIYTRVSLGVCKNRPDMTGKVVIVVGATSGVGLETARQMAQLNCRLILACRNLEKAQTVADEIRRTTENPNIVCMECDISLLASVREFAKKFLEHENRLDVLILNAGTMTPLGQRNVTKEGLEVNFATNYLGHFLLTNLLLNILKKSAPSRIVAVSSCNHLYTWFDLNNLNMEEYVLHPFFAYNNSKCAIIMFVKELTRRLKGTGVTANALHPGYVRTSLTRDMHPFHDFLFRLNFWFAKTPEEGAQTSVYLATAKELNEVSGDYFQDCKPFFISSKAKDRKLAQNLWTLSEKYAGLSKE